MDSDLMKNVRGEGADESQCQPSSTSPPNTPKF